MTKVTMNVTAEEKRHLERMRRQRGRSMSDFLRERVVVGLGPPANGGK